MTGQEDPLARAVDEYFDLVEAGMAASPFDFAGSLGDDFAEFLRAVEAKSVLEAVVEPALAAEPPRELGWYMVLGSLGRGSGGAVYEARDRRSGKRVALKLIHAGLADREAHVKRFRREGRLGSRLHHPHLMEVYEAGSVGTQHYCAMQLVEGPTLKQRLRAGPLAATPENIEQFAGLADGLSAVHRAGIIHRDVKPSNILVDVDGHFVLGDFGLLRAPLETTITGIDEAVGTIGYMSPEQFGREGGEVDTRTDIYSLGATLYEAFCGRPVIEPGSIASMLVAAQATSPPDPRRAKPDLPPALGAVIMTAMERRPEDRYQTAEALRDDLRRVCAGLAANGRPVSPLRRWVRRRPRWVAAMVTALVVAAAYGTRAATRPATVEIESHPATALVLVGGAARGRTPLRLELDPGTHDVALELDRFMRRQFRMTLGRGSNPGRTVTLLPEDVTDREAMLRLARSVGYNLDRFDTFTDRGGRALPVGRAVLPSGRCRLEDLASLRFETSPEEQFPMPARLILRRGGEILHEQPLGAADFVIESPFPTDVRQRLRVGDSVVWGVVAASGEEFLTTFEIVEESEELRAALARLDRDLGQAPASIRAFLRAHAFLAHGLALAAYREAAQPDAGVAALGTSLRALGALDAEDSLLGDALREAVAALPAGQRSDWFR